MLLSRSVRNQLARWTQRPARDLLIRKGPAIFKLPSGIDEALLIRRDPLLVVDLCLGVANRVRRLHFQRDGLAG